jgi:hypothetical protein
MRHEQKEILNIFLFGWMEKVEIEAKKIRKTGANLMFWELFHFKDAYRVQKRVCSTVW